MKKVLLVLVTVLVFGTTNSQDWSNEFPYENIVELVG